MKHSNPTVGRNLFHKEKEMRESSYWAASPSGKVDPRVKKCQYNSRTGLYEVREGDTIWGFYGEDGVPYGNSYWYTRAA